MTTGVRRVAAAAGVAVAVVLAVAGCGPDEDSTPVTTHSPDQRPPDFVHTPPTPGPVERLPGKID